MRRAEESLAQNYLALTSGVRLYLKNIMATTHVKQVPITEKMVSSIPIISLWDRYSVSFLKHVTLCLLDQYSSLQRTQVMESRNKKQIHIFWHKYQQYIGETIH